MRSLTWIVTMVLGVLGGFVPASAADFELQLRSQRGTAADPARFERVTRNEQWSPEETAIIVCDVWDLHHCLNAVRRLEEFAPRLNQILLEGRRRGAVIIHSPSDCMEAYADHPARLRATATPTAATLPDQIRFWCSRIPREEQAVYPIDQSDGGEDDDPAEHAQWSAKLTALGRNPQMPWKKQSPLITIDPDRDYLTDRGDEVWNVLEHHRIRNVILTGVHCNMCVLGRPFGLRQMARNGKNVVLMRDLTDSMYNPQRWPYVDHFTGHDLIVSHVERYVCPTISSDQILGGEPFRWQADVRERRDVTDVPLERKGDVSAFEKHWSVLDIPFRWEQATAGVLTDHAGPAWYRCSVWVPAAWRNAGDLRLVAAGTDGRVALWVNGQAAQADRTAISDRKSDVTFPIQPEWLVPDDANLIVVRVEHRRGDGGLASAPVLMTRAGQTVLHGRWQFRLGDDPAFANMPLPARFGASPDILYDLFARPGTGN